MDFLNPAQRWQFLQHLVDIQRDTAQFDGAMHRLCRPEKDEELAIEGGLSGSVLGF